jgi:hypothetical protein
MTGCCGDDYVAMCLVKLSGRTISPPPTGLVRLCGDGFVDRRVVMHWSWCHSHPQGRGGGFDPAVKKCVGRGIRVEHSNDPRQARRDLLEQLQPFSQQGCFKGAEPRDVAAGSGEALTKPCPTGSATNPKTTGIVLVC